MLVEKIFQKTKETICVLGATAVMAAGCGKDVDKPTPTPDPKPPVVVQPERKIINDYIYSNGINLKTLAIGFSAEAGSGRTAKFNNAGTETVIIVHQNGIEKIETNIDGKTLTLKNSIPYGAKAVASDSTRYSYIDIFKAATPEKVQRLWPTTEESNKKATLFLASSTADSDTTLLKQPLRVNQLANTFNNQ